MSRKLVPETLHSELTEYSSLLRALRTKNTLDVASHLQHASEEHPRDLWTRWPLPKDDLAVPEWDLEDEVSSLLGQGILEDDWASNVALSARNHLHMILASIAAYTPDRTSSLQNRIEPLNWQAVLGALTAARIPNLDENAIQNVERRMTSLLLQEDVLTTVDRTATAASSTHRLVENLTKYGASEDAIFTQSRPPQKLVPKNLPVPFVYHPSDDGTDENLLILFHGLGHLLPGLIWHLTLLGDTHIPFSKLGSTLKLPQTAVLALRAPEQVPFLDEQGFQWYTSFDGFGDLLARPNPTPALDFVSQVLSHLIDCGWALSKMHFFGFAQGGSVAVEFGLRCWRDQLQKAETKEELGSIVTIAGPLLSYPTLTTLSPTPILVVDRSSPSDLALPSGSMNAFKKGYQSVTEVKLDGRKGGMPSSKEEWQPIMKFWSEKLARRQGDGLYEVLVG